LPAVMEEHGPALAEGHRQPAFRGASD
jgi:hypothetical protein